jgi:hypothetical protein
MNSAWLPLMPLALAAAALLVRESTREVPRDVARLHESEAFQAPNLRMLGAVPATAPQRLEVRTSASRALLSGATPLFASGSADVQPEDADWSVLVRLDDSGGSQGGMRRLELRLHTIEVRSSEVPGGQTAVLRGTWASGAVGGDLDFPASWLRMPGGGARLQGVMALEGLEVSSEDGRLEWSAVRGSGATLALDLTFVLPKGPR